MIEEDMIADLTEIGMIETIVEMIIEETGLESIDVIDLETETTAGMIETTAGMIIEEMIVLLGMKEMIVETLTASVVDSISVKKKI
jgi:hypothetical protein